MTYRDLINKIELLGCWDNEVKLQSMHNNDVFTISTWHEAMKDEPSEEIERGDVIFDIELNNY